MLGLKETQYQQVLKEWSKTKEELYLLKKECGTSMEKYIENGKRFQELEKKRENLSKTLEELETENKADMLDINTSTQKTVKTTKAKLVTLEELRKELTKNGFEYDTGLRLYAVEREVVKHKLHFFDVIKTIKKGTFFINKSNKNNIVKLENILDKGHFFSVKEYNYSKVPKKYILIAFQKFGYELDIISCNYASQGSPLNPINEGARWLVSEYIEVIEYLISKLYEYIEVIVKQPFHTSNSNTYNIKQGFSVTEKYINKLFFQAEKNGWGRYSCEDLLRSILFGDEQESKIFNQHLIANVLTKMALFRKEEEFVITNIDDPKANILLL